MASSQETQNLFTKLQRTSENDASTLHSLDRLKVLSRDVRNTPVFVKDDSLTTLVKFGLKGKYPKSVAQEALRCLANTLLLNEGSRQNIVGQDAHLNLAQRLSGPECDYVDEFLCARILFLITYVENAPVEDMVKAGKLDSTIKERLVGHVSLQKPTQMQSMALSETAKLLFNIVHFRPEMLSSFIDCAEPCFELLKNYSKTLPLPLDPPVKFLVNALLNLDYGTELSQEKQHSFADAIIQTLEDAVQAYTPSKLDTEGVSLFVLARKLYSEISSTVQETMRKRLLPSNEERTKPLGKIDSLCSRLLSLSAAPNSLQLHEPIQGLFWELSGKDPEKLVQNIGLGHAAGYLVNNKIPFPSSATSASEESSSSEAINPVTGQLRADEPPDEGPPMTEEEKLREAEKLYVLIERLKATGVVDVINPVEEAFQSGRFEELD